MNVKAPQYGMIVMPKGDEKDERGKPVLMMILTVTTAVSTHQFYLCDVSDNFQHVAKQFHDKVCEAGREGRRAQSGLIVVEGGSDGLRAEKQGRQFSGPRGAG
jgi:hypothetical protein